MCSAVAVDHRDTHLGHDFENASLDGFTVVDDGLSEFSPRVVALEEFADGFNGEVGIDCCCPETNQAGHLVYVSRFPSLANKARAHALSYPDEMVVHSSHSEEHWHGNFCVVHTDVRKNENACAIINSGLGFHADATDRRFQTILAFRSVPERGDGGCLMFGTERLDGCELLVQKHGRLKAHEIGVLGGFSEKVFAPAEHGIKAHYQFLADWIDRRVCDLCKKLFEIGIKQSRLRGEDGQRSVISHRANGFSAVLQHRFDDHVNFLGGVSKSDLALSESQNIQLANRWLNLLFA